MQEWSYPKLSTSEDTEISEGEASGSEEVELDEVESDVLELSDSEELSLVVVVASSEELDSEELSLVVVVASSEESWFDALEETTSALPQTQTYSQVSPQFKVKRFQPSSGKTISSDPEPDFVPDQESEALQLEEEEDQVRVIDEPFGALSVFEENSANKLLLIVNRNIKKNLFILKKILNKECNY